MAKHRLDTLKERHWDEMSEPQRFRTLTNLGAALMQEGSFKEAGESFISAKKFAPDDEKALANEMRGYFLAARDDAFDKAGEALAKFPNNSVILSTWLNSAPAKTSFDSLESRVPASSLNDPEVLCGLARCATASGFHDRAIEFANRAAEENPAWSVPYLVRAQALARKHVAEFTRTEPELLKPATRKDLERGESDLSVAIAKAIDEKNYGLASEALVDRSVLRGYFKRTTAAEEDIEEAYRVNREDITVRRDYADLLKSRGQLDRAIEIMSGLEEKTGREDIRFVLGVFLQERNLQGDIKRAAELFMNVALEGQFLTEGMRHEAVNLAVRCFCSISDFIAAEKRPQ